MLRAPAPQPVLDFCTHCRTPTGQPLHVSLTECPHPRPICLSPGLLPPRHRAPEPARPVGSGAQVHSGLLSRGEGLVGGFWGRTGKWIHLSPNLATSISIYEGCRATLPSGACLEERRAGPKVDQSRGLRGPCPSLEAKPGRPRSSGPPWIREGPPGIGGNRRRAEDKAPASTLRPSPPVGHVTGTCWRTTVFMLMPCRRENNQDLTMARPQYP